MNDDKKYEELEKKLYLAEPEEIEGLLKKMFYLFGILR